MILIWKDDILFCVSNATSSFYERDRNTTSEYDRCRCDYEKLAAPEYKHIEADPSVLLQHMMTPIGYLWLKLAWAAAGKQEAGTKWLLSELGTKQAAAEAVGGFGSVFERSQAMIITEQKPWATKRC